MQQADRLKNQVESGEREVQERLDREAAFHDVAFSSDMRAAADKFYTVTVTTIERYRSLIFDNVAGKRVLEYGCGTGSSAFELARRGATVVGIDISPVAMEMAAEQARRDGVADRATFRLMNAEQLEFPDASFDLICGTGILHHLDLEKSYAEIARVLKPGGRGVFSEPLGHNPLINWYRNRTPEMRTPDEHPLLARDLALARNYFSSIDMRFFQLASIGIVPFRSTPLFKPLYALTEGVDRLMMKVIPPLKWWAWNVVIELKK
jgi:ubiquinone/menaquinone biosynthesis C-methylase UbiE